MIVIHRLKLFKKKMARETMLNSMHNEGLECYSSLGHMNEGFKIKCQISYSCS